MSRFMVIDTIGSGGMGVVLAAYDPELDRKIAIKLLRPDVWQGEEAAERGKRRLMREAQAMGRLSHPNVITVFEVGRSTDGGVFVAMEYVDGGTLRDRATQQRTWQEVVADYARAGRGLAAAHAAGLVHRDFKPDNVLIGKDGRVRVTDFGLVATAALPADDSLPDRPIDDANLSPTPHLDSSLTKAGSVLGTPRFMAPEQHMGGAVDARADQFGFCVALYQALYGEYPFSGSSYRALRNSVVGGERSEPPKGRDVPRHLVRLLNRGLAVDPADRYSSMEALLVDLDYDPAATKRRVVAVLGVVGLTAVAAYGFSRSKQATQVDRCPVPTTRMAGVWDSAIKTKMAQQFDKVGVPFARASFARTAKLLDGYTDAWLRSRVDTCEATHVHGEQSAALLDLRMACLDQRLTEVKALTTLFTAKPDGRLVAGAVEAAYGLTALRHCEDEAALRSVAPPPTDKATRARVDALRDRLTGVAALRLAGKIKSGMLHATSVELATRDVAYVQLQAEALLALGRLQHLAGKPDLASATLQAATVATASAKDDRRAAIAWVELVRVRGFLQARKAEALVLAGSARAAIARLGGDAELTARLLTNKAVVLKYMGKRTEAERHYRRAIDLLEKAYGRKHHTLVAPFHNLGVLYMATKRYSKARTAFQSSLDISITAFGDGHPETADAISALAIVIARQGEHKESERLQRRALTLREAALGKDHPRVAQSLNSLGVAMRRRGKLAAARRFHSRALDVWRRALGATHPNTTSPLVSLGKLAITQRRFGEAEAKFKEAEKILREARGPQSAQRLSVVRRLGELNVVRKHYKEAHAYCLQVFEARSKQDPDQPALVSSLVCLGKAEAGLKQPTRARARFTRAIELARAGGFSSKRVDYIRKLRDASSKPSR